MSLTPVQDIQRSWIYNPALVTFGLLVRANSESHDNHEIHEVVNSFLMKVNANGFEGSQCQDLNNWNSKLEVNTYMVPQVKLCTSHRMHAQLVKGFKSTELLLRCLACETLATLKLIRVHFAPGSYKCSFPHKYS